MKQQHKNIILVESNLPELKVKATGILDVEFREQENVACEGDFSELLQEERTSSADDF